MRIIASVKGVSNVSVVSRFRPVTRRLPASSCTSISRKLGVTCRTRNQAYMRRAFEDPFALLLRDAAEHGEDFALARFALEALKAIENLLLSLVTNAARVVNNEIGIGRRGDLSVSGLATASRRLFRNRGRSSGSRMSRCKTFSFFDRPGCYNINRAADA